MSWAKLDDGFYDHPKVLRAGLEAAGLFCLALSYSSRHSTDGALEGAVLERLSCGRADLVARLVEVGLFDAAESGVEIHDFLTYNPSSREVAKRRKQQRVRVSKHRKVKRTCNALPSDACNALLRDGTGRVSSSESLAAEKGESEGKTKPPTLDDRARGLLDAVNKTANTNFQPVEANMRLLRARLAEYDDWTLAAMVLRQWATWKAKPEMRPYFRPATLFGAEKCAQYVGQLTDTDRAWIQRKQAQGAAA
jgi:uncharacterized phage protein (TIGR02220 family)